MNPRLAAGCYALQVSYTLKGEQNSWPQPIQLQSDTLFFGVSRSLGPREDSLLAEYGRAVDSALAVPRPRMNGVASQWLPHFSNSRLFIDVFMDTGRDSIPRDQLFARIDPYERKPTSRAMLLDLLFRLSEPKGTRDPSTVSAFALGDLSRRVVEDWRARPRRWAFRDSVYQERKNSKYLIRGHPPYGTWAEPGNEIEKSR